MASWTEWKKGHPEFIPFCTPGGTVLSPNSELPTTSVLFIDGSRNQRAYWADQLKRCSPDYQIIEADDGQSGLDFYRSKKIDCVVMDLSLPDRSGFEVLADMVPTPRKPTVAVLVLTLLGHRTLWEIAKEYGAYACFHKKHTTGEDLDRAIHRAVEWVEQMPIEDRLRTG